MTQDRHLDLISFNYHTYTFYYYKNVLQMKRQENSKTYIHVIHLPYYTI